MNINKNYAPSRPVQPQKRTKTHNNRFPNHLPLVTMLRDRSFQDPSIVDDLVFFLLYSAQSTARNLASDYPSLVVYPHFHSAAE